MESIENIIILQDESKKRYEIEEPGLVITDFST